MATPTRAGSGSCSRISKAISAAQQVLWEITADMCVDYVAAWQRDLERWDKLLANLTRTSSVEDALEIVGLRLAISRLDRRTHRT